MLGGIETLLRDALAAAGLPEGTAILAGPPTAPPRPGDPPRLVLHARSLVRAAPPEGEARERPGGAWASRRHLIAGPDRTPRGNRRAFTLPPDALALVEEVQAPPGTIAALGDEVSLDGRVLRFLRDRPGPIEVITRAPGPALGWRDRAPAELRLDIAALAPAAPEADALLAAGLAGALAALAGREVATLAWVDPPGLRLRLLDIAVLLDGVARDAVPAASGAEWVRASATLRLRGMLETMLAAGVPEPAGTIAAVETRLQLPGGAEAASRVGRDDAGQ
jgi:hypothetical protein